MFQSFSIPLWTAIAAIAAVGQLVVLIVTARFVWRYLQATEDLVKSTRDQLSESRELVKAAHAQVVVGQKQVEASHSQIGAAYEQITAMREQVAIAQDQLEAQIRPAVAIYPDPKWGRFLADNVGIGPAFDLKFVLVPADSSIQWDTQSNVQTTLNGSFLGIGHHEPEEAIVQLCGGVTQEMQIMYKSLSGREYFSIVRFDDKHRPVRTRIVKRSFT